MVDGDPRGQVFRWANSSSDRADVEAKFIELTTMLITAVPGQRSPVLDWPYVEGLRLDEAMHPLTILGVGLYGEILPNQNGAPLRLVVPWKYGFKGIKSIVKIRFVGRSSRRRPGSVSCPRAYGFYANVNPAVDHPRWSQATETRLPSLLKITKTQLFNGCGPQVASLYAGMDLKNCRSACRGRLVALNILQSSAKPVRRDPQYRC